ncbi:hypothetical protein DER44DRAFT_748433 [Fusarium oxysporum]|nr:hypothetical protein DER44DRAFT_748433 [Fusarium oxysporum]
MQKNRNSTTLPPQLEISINEDGDFVVGTHMENLLSYWVSRGLSDERAAKFREVYKLGKDLDERFRKSVNEEYDHSDVNTKVFHNVDVLEELLAWDEVQHVQLFLTGQNGTATSDVSQTVKRYFILVKELMVEEFSKKSSNGFYSTMRRSCEANSFESTTPRYQWMFDGYLRRQRDIAERRVNRLEPAIRRSTRPLIEASGETSQDVFPRKWVEAMRLDKTFQHAGSSDLQSNPAKAVGLDRESRSADTSSFESNLANPFSNHYKSTHSPFGRGFGGKISFGAGSQGGNLFSAKPKGI